MWSTLHTFDRLTGQCWGQTWEDHVHLCGWVKSAWGDDIVLSCEKGLMVRGIRDRGMVRLTQVAGYAVR